MSSVAKSGASGDGPAVRRRADHWNGRRGPATAKDGRLDGYAPAAVPSSAVTRNAAYMTDAAAAAAATAAYLILLLSLSSSCGARTKTACATRRADGTKTTAAAAAAASAHCASTRSARSLAGWPRRNVRRDD